MLRTFCARAAVAALGAGLLPALATAQASIPDSVRRTVHLPEVAVSGRLQQHVLTSYHGKYAAGARPMAPGVRCAVWLPSPDSTQLFRLTSLTIPLHARFQVGHLKVSLHRRGQGAELLGSALLAQPFIITSPDSIPRRRTQLRLNLRPAQLELPADGVYVVFEGLPTHSDEVFVKHRVVRYGKIKKDGHSRGEAFVLTRRGPDTTTIWTPYNDFAKLRQSAAGYVCHTWMQWAPQWPFKRESVHGIRGRPYPAHDVVVLLAVESAQ